MIITRIEPQKKRPGRKNIYADGEFVAGVSDETLLAFGLRTGDEITPERIKLLERAEELFGAKSAALRFLAVRPRSEREVRDRLREKEFGDEEIQKTVEDLTSAGLLDDDAFARAYIRNALALRPVGRVALMRKLLLLGVAKEKAVAALEETLAGTDQEADAARAAAGFLKRSASLSRREDPRKTRARLTAFLLRRGYTWEIVRPVVQKAVAGGGADDEGTGERRH
jgi:regulatory protein